MALYVPENLRSFLKYGLEDCDDGFEYCSELNRILNSDNCQLDLLPKEIEKMRDFAQDVKKVGEFNYYSKMRVDQMEKEIFGSKGILGFLGEDTDTAPSGLSGLFKD